MPEERKAVTIYLTDEQHKEIKKLLIDEEVSLSEWIRKQIDKKLNSKNK